jgi:hypothetical protein
MHGCQPVCRAKAFVTHSSHRPTTKPLGLSIGWGRGSLRSLPATYGLVRNERDNMYKQPDDDNGIEIEWGGFAIEMPENSAWWVVGVFAVLLLFGLGALGKSVTPYYRGEAAILSLSEYQVMRAQRAYAAELSQMQQDLDELVSLINERPNAVLAQMAAERIEVAFAEGEPALYLQRELLIEAAYAVRDWSVGVTDRDTAYQSLQAALESVQALGEANE